MILHGIYQDNLDDLHSSRRVGKEVEPSCPVISPCNFNPARWHTRLALLRFFPPVSPHSGDSSAAYSPNVAAILASMLSTFTYKCPILPPFPSSRSGKD